MDISTLGAAKSYTDSAINGLSINVQSDWNETDNTSDAFIKNKPTIIAEIPEYNIIKVQDDDYVFVYQLTKTIDEEIVNVGEAINIPKDMVVQSGDVKTCTTVNVPVSGYKVGDKYIDLLIANSNNQHIYILVSDLVDNNASGIKYDNTSSGLAATNVQTAINELNTNKASKAVATLSANGLLSSADKALIDVMPRSKTIDQILGINVYKDFVIPLIEVTTGVENTYFCGRIFLKRTNGANDEITIINAMCGKRYNEEKAAYNIDSSEVFTPIKPCVFTYNSKKYFGIHVNIASAEYEIFRVDARTTTNYNDIKMIFIYDTNTSQIINAEIYNSLDFATTGTSVNTNFYAIPQFVDSNYIKRKLLYFSPVPATLTSTGTAGDVAYDSDYMYTCIATNTWKRSAFDKRYYNPTIPNAAGGWYRVFTNKSSDTFGKTLTFAIDTEYYTWQGSSVLVHIAFGMSGFSTIFVISSSSIVVDKVRVQQKLRNPITDGYDAYVDIHLTKAQPYFIRGIDANYFNIVTPSTVAEIETGFSVTSVDCKSGITCNKDIYTSDGGKAFEPKLQLSGKKIQMVDQTGAIKSEVDLSSLIP